MARRSSRRSRRSTISAGVISFARAAASSIASGRPSSSRQTLATASAFVSSSVKSGSTACARFTNNITDAAASTAGSGAWLGGTGSTSTGTWRSTAIRAGTRLVSRNVTLGHASTRRVMAMSNPCTCSTLSSTTNTRFVSSAPASASTTSRSAGTRTWSARATASSAEVPSRASANATNAAPSGCEALPRSRRAASIAKRVFPTPPVPTRVTTRTSGSSRTFTRRAKSSSRPSMGLVTVGSGGSSITGSSRPAPGA